MEQKIPACIGVIMDGNRRWAKANNLPTFEGHRRGHQTMKKLVEWAEEAGVKTVIVFAFSEENWKRAAEEVSFMMSLVREILASDTKEAIEKNIRLKYIGDVLKFPEDIARGMWDAEEKTKNNTGTTLAIAVSYGGRQEIIHVVNELMKEGKTEITAEDIDAHMYTAGLPDPDIIIRTSGEMRLSGFLPWQGVYSELFFTNTLWPDFSKEEFLKIINEYSTTRERRMGK
jgi:undecaprenyl diphosphate synthase